MFGLALPLAAVLADLGMQKEERGITITPVEVYYEDDAVLLQRYGKMAKRPVVGLVFGGNVGIWIDGTRKETKRLLDDFDKEFGVRFSDDPNGRPIYRSPLLALRVGPGEKVRDVLKVVGETSHLGKALKDACGIYHFSDEGVIEGCSYRLGPSIDSSLHWCVAVSGTLDLAGQQYPFHEEEH